MNNCNIGVKTFQNKKYCFGFGSLLFVLLLAQCEVQSNDFIDRRIYSVEVVDSFGMDTPLKRFVYKKPFFYAYNFYSKQIQKHNRGFEMVNAMGGEGDAPFENRVILNYAILDCEDRLGIFDSDKNTYKIQDWNDSIFLYLKIDRNFDRGVVLSDSTIFISYTYDNDMKLGFAIINSTDGTYFELMNFNKEFSEPTSSFIYEGKLVKFGDKVYSFSYLFNEFFVFDLQGLSVKRIKN